MLRACTKCQYGSNACVEFRGAGGNADARSCLCGCSRLFHLPHLAQCTQQGCDHLHRYQTTTLWDECEYCDHCYISHCEPERGEEVEQCVREQLRLERANGEGVAPAAGAVEGQADVSGLDANREGVAAAAGAVEDEADVSGPDAHREGVAADVPGRIQLVSCSECEHMQRLHFLDHVSTTETGACAKCHHQRSAHSPQDHSRALVCAACSIEEGSHKVLSDPFDPFACDYCGHALADHCDKPLSASSVNDTVSHTRPESAHASSHSSLTQRSHQDTRLPLPPPATAEASSSEIQCSKCQVRLSSPDHQLCHHCRSDSSSVRSNKSLLQKAASLFFSQDCAHPSVCRNTRARDKNGNELSMCHSHGNTPEKRKQLSDSVFFFFSFCSASMQFHWMYTKMRDGERNEVPRILRTGACVRV